MDGHMRMEFVRCFDGSGGFLLRGGIHMRDGIYTNEGIHIGATGGGFTCRLSHIGRCILSGVVGPRRRSSVLDFYST